jgi:uncharacterized protein YkwD
MKKILFILLVPTILFAQKKVKNLTIYSSEPKYKAYIDTINSWDFKKQLTSWKMDSKIKIEFDSLNNYRKSLGLPELKYDSTLELSAKIQSFYCQMVLKGGISHVNSSSELFKDIINRDYFVRDILKVDKSKYGVHIRGEIITASSGYIMGFKSSPLHHLQILNSKFTHVGIYINDGNMVVVFGVDFYNENDVSKYPKFDLNSDIVKYDYYTNQKKQFESTYKIITIGNDKRMVNGKTPILVFRENGSAFYLYPPYKTTEKVYLQLK